MHDLRGQSHFTTSLLSTYAQHTAAVRDQYTSMSEQSEPSDTDSTGVRNKRKVTSWVWNHLRKIENDTKGECNHCSKLFAIGISAATGKDKGTKSLSDHLKSKHSTKPTVAAALVQDNQAKEGRKTKQQKVKDMLLASNQMPLPNNSDKVICIKRAILEMIAVHNRPFEVVEDFMLLFCLSHFMERLHLSFCRFLLTNAVGRVCVLGNANNMCGNL